MRIIRFVLFPALLLAHVAFVAEAQEDEPAPWPDWLSLQGEQRIRYEALSGQFRRGGEGGDQLLLSRFLLTCEANFGPVSLGLEFQDSRTELSRSGTPLTNSIANPLDVLQAYVKVKSPGGLGAGSSGELILGRQTVSIGSKRQIERVDFANVIKTYTGAHWIATKPRGDELHLVYVVPVARFPSDRESLVDNDLVANEEQWGRRIWAVHYRRANLFPQTAPDLWGELFAYGLEERDTSDLQTPNRSYVAPGFRLYRRPQPGQWDIDFEAALRQGSRHATSNPGDVQDLDVDASMLFAVFGYTFDRPWQPRLSFEYYYASGDDDPNDNRFDQHERLFGSRRSDLNNTSIHGPLTPANLSNPGIRLEVVPNQRWDARLKYSAAFLASDTDAWVIARLRDPSGRSGDFIGHTIDSRVRYWIVPKKLRLEFGGSALFFGEFAKNVEDGPAGHRTLFGYAQLTFSF